MNSDLRKVVEVADRLGALTSRAHRCVGMAERVCRLIDRRLKRDRESEKNKQIKRLLPQHT